MTEHTPFPVPAADTPAPQSILAERLIPLAVGLAALIGRLPALGAWWNQDDWGLLARAAGMDTAAATTARFLSQNLWWSVTWPVFGLDPAPHALARMFLHAASAVVVTVIGRRAGLRPLARLLAGLLFAASPLAFTPLYWAAGVQELLAGFFALLAVERWLAGGRRAMAMAALTAALSFLAKESGMGLPLLFLVFAWLGLGVRLADKPFAWAMCLLLMLAAIVEGVLVMNSFATDVGDPYALGGPLVVLGNLGVFGWWLASPGPIFASGMGWTTAAGGGAVFVLWAVWGAVRWHRGSRLALLALVAALLSLAPALPLKGQTHPYLAYLAAAAGSLALVTIVPARWRLGRTMLLVLTLAAMAWGFGGMRIRLGNRDATGLPADSVARSTALSWQVCRILPNLPLDRAEGQRQALTLLQMPLDPVTAGMADRLGDRWVTGSNLYHALGGAMGPRFVLGDSIRVDWVNALFTNPRDALVLCEFGYDFKHWGPTGHAALYAALTDIGLGRFDRARKHMLRAGDLGAEDISFAWDPEQLIVPLDKILAQKEAFVDWTVRLMPNQASGQEVGGLQEMFLNLLQAATGQSLEELTAGSEALSVEPIRGEQQWKQ